MTSVHKYNSLLSQAKKQAKTCDDNDTTKDIKGLIKSIFDIYKEIDILRDKEYKKYKENLIDNEIFSGILENILNDSICFAAIKTKKVKKEIMVCLLSDFISHIGNSSEFDFNEYHTNQPDQFIVLVHTTRCFFGSYKKFVISDPVIYKCPYNIYCKIYNTIKTSEKPDDMEFDISKLTSNSVLQQELENVISAYNKS
jgi:hypothetical protein